MQVGLLLAEDRDPPMPMHLVIARELEIVGSHGMPAHAFPPLLKLIRSGRVDPCRLVRRTVSLEDSINELAGMAGFNGAGIAVIDQFSTPN